MESEEKTTLDELLEDDLDIEEKDLEDLPI